MAKDRTAKAVRWGLVALVLFSGSCAATDRDPIADLVNISARFVEAHARAEHRAGDADAQFIEDVIVPSVRDVVERGGSRVTDAQRDAVIGFLLAARNSASEEISGIAAQLYGSQGAKLCASVAKLGHADRMVILDSIKSGLASVGQPVPRSLCL